MDDDKQRWWTELKSKIGPFVVLPDRVNSKPRNRPVPRDESLLWTTVHSADMERYIAQNRKMMALRAGQDVVRNSEPGIGVKSGTRGLITRLDHIGHTMWVSIEGELSEREYWRGYWDAVQ